MKRLSAVLLVMFLVVGLSGCAGWTRDDEIPRVTINSFRSLPGEHQGPRFEIGLHITNPSDSKLVLEGMAYTLELNGYEVLNGVTNQLPMIEPYGQADVVVQAQVDLIGSIQFIAGLIREKQQSIPYRLEAKLDPEGWRPNMYAHREGTINLSSQ